jgi:hypothetical protein
LSLGITVVVLAVLAVGLALLSQPRIFSLDPTASLLVVREDFTGSALGDLFGQAIGGLIALFLMVVGGMLLLDEDNRWVGLAMWLGSFLVVYNVAKDTRDTLTLSELRVDLRSRSVSCAGFLLGRRAWTESALLPEIQSVSFPVGLGPRHGVVVSARQGPLCSLHNRALSKDEAKRLSGWLAEALGDTLGVKVEKLY